MDLAINDILSELHFMYITSGIIMPIFIGLGLIGNIIILVVLCEKSMRSAPVCLLQALAIHDILNMIYAAYADVYPAVTAYDKANNFIKSLEDVKRQQDEKSFDKLDYTSLYYYLQLLDTHLNRSSASAHFMIIDLRKQLKNESEHTENELALTTSKTDLLSTTEKQIISFTNDDRNDFIIRSIERFIGYNIIYIGLLFALCLTSERCIAVLFPMKVGNCLTIKRTRTLIIIMVCICLLVHSPQLIKEIILVYEYPNDLFNNETGLILSFRSIYERFYVISSLIICVLMLVLNGLLLWKIISYRKSIKLSKHTRRVERNELNVSLLIVVLIFFQLPHYIFVIVISFITKEIYLDDFTTITRASVIIRLLYIIQSALNFVIYCLFAKRFRDFMHIQYSKLLQKLCRRTTKDGDGNKISTSRVQTNMISFANVLDVKVDVKAEKSTSV